MCSIGHELDHTAGVPVGAEANQWPEDAGQRLANYPRPGGARSTGKVAKTWCQLVSIAFLNNYFKSTSGSQFLPQQGRRDKTPLSSYMLERALTEIKYELEHRPEWIRIPVPGILEQLKPA